MNRHLLTSLGLLAVLSVVLAACAAPTGDAGAEESMQREIVWMVRTNVVENPWEQDVAIPAFEAANPDIKVSLLIVDQVDIAVKRDAMIAAGEPLHVWSPNWGGHGFPSDRMRGLLYDLSPLIERDSLDTSVFIPEVLAIYEHQGRQYGLPFLTTGSYTFYNMDLFDAAGVEYPPVSWDDETWTWDRALAIAQELTVNPDDPMNATYGWVEGTWPGDAITWLFDAYPWSDDALDTGFAQSIDFTSEGAVNAFQSRHDLTYKHKVAPDAAAIEGLNALGGDFQSGKVAMKTTGGWGWWVYSPVTPEVEGGFCWGVAPLPFGTPGAPTRAAIFTDLWSITAGMEGQELEDSWTLIKYLVSEDAARAYMQATNTPPTQHKLLEEWYQQFGCMDPADVKDVYQGAFANGLKSSNHLMVGYDEIGSTWDNLLGGFWNDPEGDAASLLPDVEAAINEVLLRIAEEYDYSFE